MRLLLVEDNPADARLVREFLRSVPGEFALSQVDRLDGAVRALGEQAFDAVLLDLGLPDALGLDAVAPLNALVPDVPIVVMTGNDDEDMAARVVQAGAQDYLVKGDARPRDLARALRYALERKQYERRIRYLADHDPLTRLPHRRLLRDRLRQAIGLSRRNKQLTAVLFIDLDLFKQINDTLGHPAGDSVLRQVARRLARCVRESDTVARIGGDEFAIVATVSDVEHARLLADKVLARLTEPMTARGRSVRVSASVGISMFPHDGDDGDALLQHADLAMYRAKQEGRNRHCVFVGKDLRRVPRRLALMSGLRDALEHGGMALHFQPVIDLASDHLCAVEALLRWQHPQLGAVPPSEIIPLAEESRMMGPIGDWIFRHAAEQARAWAARRHPAPRVAVNLSRAQIESGHLAVEVTNAFAATGLAPWMLELDVAASVLASCPEPALEVVRDVRATGVRILLDDFGVEPIALGRLKSLPIDGLKIDPTLVAGCARNPADAAVVHASIALAHGMGLEVTAEGVEEAAQLNVLRAAGCDRAQGRLFGRPMTAEDLGKAMRGTWH